MISGVKSRGATPESQCLAEAKAYWLLKTKRPQRQAGALDGLCNGEEDIHDGWQPIRPRSGDEIVRAQEEIRSRKAV